MFVLSGRYRWPAVIAAGLFALSLAGAAEKPKAPPEPQASSISPLAGQAGSTWDAAVKGVSLAGAYAVRFHARGLAAEVISAEAELVRLRIRADAGVPAGKHEFDLVTPRGVSSTASLRVVHDPVLDGSPDRKPLAGFPIVLNGRLDERGEVDSYWIEVAAGQELTLQAFSGYASFDPSLAVMEETATFFEDRRLVPVASNDEPLFFPQLSVDARLTHRFTRAGKYCIQVSSFTGMAGPDFNYAVRISPGAAPPPKLHPHADADWEERQFTRRIPADWPVRLATRSGAAGEAVSLETYHAAPEGSPQVPSMKIPGIVEGRLAQPGVAHEIRFRLDEAQLLAIEIETPESTMPVFNPVVRLIDDAGREVVGNVYTKRNNNGLYMMKMIEAKTVFDLRAPGEYRLQIHDITTDRAGESFAYRVLLRPQIPHLGKVAVAEKRVNLAAGQAKPVTVTVEREEGYQGTAVVTVEGLPPGVSALPAAENEIERPPLPNAGRPERYSPKPQTRVVLLAASPDAEPVRMPVDARVVVRPLIDGKIGDPVAVERLPVMLIAQPAETEISKARVESTK